MGLRSKIACEFSVERIVDPHMWTFTFSLKIEPRVAATLWSNLSRDLVRHLGMWGVRVYEPHPGGHGLHVHAVVSGFYDVDCVRAYAKRHGFGRIHVCEVDDPGYIAKYLSKSRRNTEWKGIRLWASFGVKRSSGWKPSRVKDVTPESPTGTLYRQMAAVVKPYNHCERFRLMKLVEKCRYGALRWRVIESTTGFLMALHQLEPNLFNSSEWMRVSGKAAQIEFVDAVTDRLFVLHANRGRVHAQGVA